MPSILLCLTVEELATGCAISLAATQPMLDGRRISITTGSMNRLTSLRRSLASWVQLSEVDEILIVDWGSDPPLANALSCADARIRIVRVMDRGYWENARCHNLEWRLAGGDWILRLDNDHVLAKTFFVRHPPKSGTFWAGDWRCVPAEIDDKRNVTGALFVERQHLRAVNGYNERLVYYGQEDDELYARLERSGLWRQAIDLSTIEHIPHSDEDRYKHLRISALVPPAPQPYEWQWHQAFARSKQKLSFLLAVSHEICKRQPWTGGDRMARWVTKPAAPSNGRLRLEICKELGDGQPAEDSTWQIVE